jgi:hypothetical protein
MLKAIDFWTSHHIPKMNIGHWKIGPLELWIRRFENEWRIYSRSLENPYLKDIIVQIPSSENHPPNITVHRFGVHETTDVLSFQPVLADRSIVVRPEKPFHIPAKEEVPIYVMHSVWLKINYGTNAINLTKIPIYRPSDTWFGSNTIDGELCYSTRSKAKIRFDDLELFPYRAVTKIQLQNKSNNDVFLERLKVALPSLSLYLSENQVFFTDSLIYSRQPEGKEINISIHPPPLDVAGKCILIHKPLVKPEQNLVSKAINHLLG